MPRVITTLQAMSHPTVVETINCLSEMSQRLQDENDELRAALAQLKQEPYGYFKAEPFGWVDCAETDDGAKALYEAPPQRTWVGLTDEERSSFWTADYMTQKEWDRLFDSIEDKLKQKNT